MITPKQNSSIKIIVDEEWKFLTNGSGNTLSLDKSYRHLSDTSI